jgi:hypothetical protein
MRALPTPYQAHVPVHCLRPQSSYKILHLHTCSLLCCVRLLIRGEAGLPHSSGGTIWAGFPGSILLSFRRRGSSDAILPCSVILDRLVPTVLLFSMPVLEVPVPV